MKKNCIHAFFAGAFLLWLAIPTTAQVINPSTPDFNIAAPGDAPFVSTVNTAEVEIPAGGGGAPLQVMVWGGGNPAFGWDYAGTTGTAPIAGSGIGNISQIDIVTDPSANPGDERVLIIYETNFSEVYFEVHSWTGATFTLTAGPTLLSGSSSSVSHPNVDIYFNGRAVMTWSENGVVYAQGYVLPALNLSPNVFKPSACITADCDRSDVASFRPNGAPGNRTNFIFVANYGSFEELIIQRASWNQVWNGVSPVCAFGWTNVIDAVTLSAEQFGVPRIACPNRLFPGLYVREDLSAVCLKYDNSTAFYTINNYTHHALSFGLNVFNTQPINTNPFDLSPCGNKYPTVSYAGEFIISTWTFDDCMGLINGDLDIVARQLNFDGNPVFNDYSLVNQNVFGQQLYSANDGKFSTTQDCFYAWSDGTNQSIDYKFSFFTNQSLRKSTSSEALETEPTALEALEFSVFPNPVADNAVFSIDLADNEIAESLEVYSLSGQLVDRVALTETGVGNNQVEWQAAELPTGVYVVRLITNQRSESLRFTRQ